MNYLRLSFLCFLVFLFSLRPILAVSTSLEVPLVTPQIMASVNAVQGGESFEVIIELSLKEGWHSYWQYAGDAGFPPSIRWQLPPGWSATPLVFSLPEQFLEPGDVLVYGYKSRCFLKSTLTPPSLLSGQRAFSIEATLSWLVCAQSCVPGTSHLSLLLPTVSPEEPLKKKPLFSSEAISWPEEGAPPFPISFLVQGDHEVLCFQGKEGSSYQLFPDPAAGTVVGHASMTSDKNHHMITLPWEEKSSFRGLLVETSLTGVRRGWWVSPSLEKTLDRQPQQACPLQPMPTSWVALLVALGSGLLGGLILNLMPCVLPVISLKIFGFIAQARENRSKILRHGLAFIAGIYLWFMGMGGLIVLLKASGKEVTWAFQFQNSTFLLIISALVFLFALNLFGVFEMVLPGRASNSLDKLAAQEGYGGSFFQGLFATLLATPCTAPFLGSALGFAFAQSGIVIMVIFFSIATGMALPYFFLSLQPAWVKWVPRRGAWVERVKQMMGFPLIATNLWLLGVLGRQHGVSGVLKTLLLFLALSVSAWLYGAFYSSKRLVRFFALTLGIVITLLAFVKIVPQVLQAEPPSSLLVEKERGSLPPVSQEAISWIPYSAEKLEELRKQGKAVFLDFTAAWCLTCQFNERTAINTAAVRTLLREHHIVAMKADWTNANPEITKALHEFNRVGIPYYVFYPPGRGSIPVTFSELLRESQLIKAFSEK